jgi:hypothetical protein
MRGQLAGQVFIYILGMIVVGAIMLIGLRAVTYFGDSKCAAQETKFATELASAFESNKKYGVSRVVQFNLPCDAEAVCFVSRHVVDAYPNAGLVDEAELLEKVPVPIIASNIIVGDNTNVYLRLKDNTYKGLERFSASAPITLRDEPGQTKPFICISGDPARIRFLGQGQLVEVQQE